MFSADAAQKVGDLLGCFDIDDIFAAAFDLAGIDVEPRQQLNEKAGMGFVGGFDFQMVVRGAGAVDAAVGHEGSGQISPGTRILLNDLLQRLVEQASSRVDAEVFENLRHVAVYPEVVDQILVQVHSSAHAWFDIDVPAFFHHPEDSSGDSGVFSRDQNAHALTGDGERGSHLNQRRKFCAFFIACDSAQGYFLLYILGK